MADAPGGDRTSRQPSQNNGLAVWGLLLFGLVVAVSVVMSKLEKPVHGYFLKFPHGQLYWDTYVDGLFLPAVGVCMYAALFVGMGLIILPTYRALRALLTRGRETVDDL